MGKKSNNENVLGIVLAGGRSEMFFLLTNDRAKPAVSFGGNYRIIDFVLSSFVNFGISRIYLLTRFKSRSLANHLAAVWRLADFLQNRFVKAVPCVCRRFSQEPYFHVFSERRSELFVQRRHRLGLLRG